MHSSQHPWPAMPIDVRTLALAGAALSSRTSRVVGWGSGSVFAYFHGLYPVRLDYLVDNDPGRWGRVVDGIEVVPPERLASEDPARTFVVIYSSAWPDIHRQLAEMGAFPSLPASAAFADGAARARLARSERLAAAPPAPRVPRSRNAIVVQGPVLPAITARVLRVTAAVHPDDRVILSTWRDTNPELLDEARCLADDVVLSHRPRQAGIQNRNCQIVSTAAGIERAIALGAGTILKTRTDLAVLAGAVFEQARWWFGRSDHGAARVAGLHGRLIVPASYTRKFLLYHPSDLVMLGAADDMAQYWAAPLDPRHDAHPLHEWIDLPLSSANMDGHPAESYLGIRFCRSIGRPHRATLDDSWAFYRDLFTVVDNDWFDLLWFKNLSIPDAATREGVRQLITHRFWRRLRANDPALSLDMTEVDIETLTMRGLTGACA